MAVSERPAIEWVTRVDTPLYILIEARLDGELIGELVRQKYGSTTQWSVNTHHWVPDRSKTGLVMVRRPGIGRKLLEEQADRLWRPAP